MQMEDKQIPANSELRFAQGPISIERFQPQYKYIAQHGQTEQTYSIAKNCTSLNLQFISVQKMDNVLHSIQRRLYKQKEQLVFAEYIKSTEAGTRFVKIGTKQVCLERGSKFTNNAYANQRVHVAIDKKSHSEPNENFAIRELVNEFKNYIAAQTTSGGSVQLYSDDKQSLRQRKDKNIAAVSRNCLALQNGTKNMKSLGGEVINKAQQLKKVDHYPMKPAIKMQRFGDKRPEADLKKNMESVILASKPKRSQPSQLMKYWRNSEISSGKGHDALALWKALSEMEKVEELVCRNLQMVNANVKEKVPVMGRKEISGNTGPNIVSSEKAISNYSSSGSEDKPSTHEQILKTVDMDTSMPISQISRYRHHNSSFATKFFSPNSDIVAAIKEISNTVVDELLIEISDEILDLPEAFLRELLETEFANNNLQR